MSSSSTSPTPTENNNNAGANTGTGKKPYKARYDKKGLKLEIRRMRSLRLPERDIMHDLEISRSRFYKLMDEIDAEDAKTLGFDNPMRLHSEINLYREELAYCIKINKGICEANDVAPEDKQESTRIIADCALTWVKIQMEGPKVLREVYQPIGSYVAFEGQPVPVPKSQRDKLTADSAVQQVGNGTGISIPLTSDEPQNNNDSQ